MNELVKIKCKKIGIKSANSVNAKDLYDALEIKQQFSHWIKAQIKRAGLRENIEYKTISQRVGAGSGTSIKKIYIITADSSKHIAMMSQGNKASEVRDYFIAVEDKHLKQLESKSSDYEELEEYRQIILEQNKLIAQQPKPSPHQGSFMNDPHLHNHFLDFLFQANKLIHEVGSIRHLSAKVDVTHQSLSNFMLYMTNRYENIKGVSKYRMPKINEVKNELPFRKKKVINQ